MRHTVRIATVFACPVLIPGPIGARCVTVDHLQLDLGSVHAGGKPGQRDCTGPVITAGESLVYKLVHSGLNVHRQQVLSSQAFKQVDKLTSL